MIYAIQFYSRHVLTAAHCVVTRVQNAINTGSYFMRLGTSLLSNVREGTIRKVVNAYTHPKYRGVPYFDAAIYEADVDIEFTKWIRPICLPMRPVDDENALAGMYS